MRTSRKIKNKIKSLSAIKSAVLKLKNKNKKIVFTNGCFDILHYGHAKYLEDAKKKGDILIVAINSDSSVRRIKGKKRPLIPEKYRLNLVAALECVDFVTLFKDNTPLKTITAIKPDILVKGSDWGKNNIVGGEFVKGYGGKVLRINLVKGLSTSNIIKKIVKTYQ